MAEHEPQSYANHRRTVPAFHYFALGVLVLNLLYAASHVLRWFSAGYLLQTLTAAALLTVAFYARAFALTAQDRIIRLEERLRLEPLLPDDLRPRIGELAPAQLVALRFAGDEELAELVREVLDQKIADRDAIKRKIKDWRADHLRV